MPGTWNDDVRDSLLKISLNSGYASTYNRISGGTFYVGTSAGQFPNTSALQHIVRLLQSGIIYVAGTSGVVSSGVGLWVGGDPSYSTATLDLKIGNLNLLYGIAVTSTPVTYISFNT